MSHAVALPAEVDHREIGFQTVVSRLSLEIPEIAEQQEGIVARGEELIHEFGLKPELLEDGAHALFFSAIAQRYDDLEQRKDTLSADEYTREKEFIADATVLLALDSSEYYDEMKPLIDTNDKHESEYEEQVYDRLTNVPVSKELATAIRETDLLAGVKERLGVTTENEEPFEVRVMNITDVSTLNGMLPSLPASVVNASFESRTQEESEADAKIFAEHAATLKSFEEYGAGLKAGADEFRNALDHKGRIPATWFTTINGVKTLAMSLPLAEKILYKNEPRSSYYSDYDQDREFSLLEHEYTHTQGGLNLGGNVFYGISAEEKRAEHFARNKQGYLDVKGADLDLGIIAGIDTAAFMNSQVKGGTAESFFSMIANEVGLQGALELALTAPNAYVESEARPLQAHVAEHLGGSDGFIKRIYQKNMEDPKRRMAMLRRIDNFAGRIARMPSSNNWAANRKVMGLEFVTDKIMDRVDALSVPTR